jgi:hypothetical protein
MLATRSPQQFSPTLCILAIGLLGAACGNGSASHTPTSSGEVGGLSGGSGGSSGAGAQAGIIGSTAAAGGSPGTAGNAAGGAGIGGSVAQGSVGGSTAAGGGSPGTGGTAAVDAGIGGAVADGSGGVTCSDNGGIRFAAAARQCAQDSECTIQIARTCCGFDVALGLAKSKANAYSGCFPPGSCTGLGCAKSVGYSTDSGQSTPWDPTVTQPIDRVTVQCVDNLCTTTVVLPADAGRDAAQENDAVPDANNACGSATCGSGQACVLTLGGTRPPCEPVGDAGCTAGLVYTDSCSNPMTGAQGPGCTTPTPVPGCVNLPAGCTDPCKCICPTGGGAGCYPASNYITCAMP